MMTLLDKLYDSLVHILPDLMGIKKVQGIWATRDTFVDVKSLAKFKARAHEPQRNTFRFSINFLLLARPLLWASSI